VNEPAQVIGLGELLWDCFPDRRRPGGAPANVAYQVQQLGLSAAVASRVGNDDLGHEICAFLVTQGLSTELIQIDAHRQTGTVTISPVTNSDVNYHFLENSAWDFLTLTPELHEAVTSAEAICFGTLAQRRPTSRHTIYECLQKASDNCLTVYDVNLRPPFFAKEWIAKSIERSRIVKMNHEEVKVLSKLFDIQTADETRFCRTLLDRYKKLELVCVTRGKFGCLAVSCEESLELPGHPVEVIDTVGAGDAFTAAIIFGRLQNWPLPKTVDLANRFGALVARFPGAMPEIHSELGALKAELDWSYRPTPPIQKLAGLD
jgi:fructokinase